MYYKIDNPFLTSFRVTKLFNESKITAMDYSSDGSILMTCGDDDKINIYDCKNGVLIRELKSEKYGAYFINFIHDHVHAIHASNKVNDDLRLINMDQNRYINYFKGHTNLVTSLNVSKTNNNILSTSLDKTLRVWDCRAPSHVLMKQFNEQAIGTWAPQDDNVFAVGINSSVIKLFDLRSQVESFRTFSYYNNKNFFWLKMKYSFNGQEIMINSKGPAILLKNSLTGAPNSVIVDVPRTDCLWNEASYTPDSRYVISGGTCGLIHIWDGYYHKKLYVIDSDQTSTIKSVNFNPTQMMFATVSDSLMFWQPTLHLTEKKSSYY